MRMVARRENIEYRITNVSYLVVICSSIMLTLTSKIFCGTNDVRLYEKRESNRYGSIKWLI